MRASWQVPHLLSVDISSRSSHFLLYDHQRVRLPLPCASPVCAKSLRGGIRGHWDTLRRLTRQRLHQGGAFRVQNPAPGSPCAKESSWCSVRRGSYPPTEPLCRAAASRPYFQPHYKQMSSCRICCSKPVSQCRVCYTNLLWERSLNRSAPSVYNSVLIGKKRSVIISSLRPPLLRFGTATFSGINNVCLFIGDNIVEELDSGDEDEAGASAGATSSLPTPRGWTASPPCLTVPYYKLDDYFHRGVPHRFRSQSPRIRTAPPSPLRPHRVVNLPSVPPVELAKQESLDELRTTVQLAASSMENSTKDIKLLGEKMAAATERMSDSVQDNSQALVLLAQVVDRLQMLLATTRTDINSPNPAAAEQDSTPKKTLYSREQRPSLTHQSGCSFPSLPSSTSSSSFNSSLDAPSTSQGTSCLPVSCHGSPRTTLKTKNAPQSQKKHVQAEPQASKHPLTNGKLDEPKETSHNVKGDRSSRRKKKRKKATWEVPKSVQRVDFLGPIKHSGSWHLFYISRGILLFSPSLWTISFVHISTLAFFSPMMPDVWSPHFQEHHQPSSFVSL